MVIREYELKIKKLNSDAIVPKYMSEQAAGMDLCSIEDVVLEVGQIKAVGTGLAIAIPSCFEAQLRPRSGMALKHGISLNNSPGTIDADYRGEVKVILINLGSLPFEIKKGDRIAQMVIAPVVHLPIAEVEDLDATNRGDGGFGSTGK